MEEILSLLKNKDTELLEVVFSDKFWFFTFEATLIAYFIYAFLKDNFLKESSPVNALIRGKESRDIIVSAASGFLSLVLSVIFSISTYPKDGKVAIYLLNLIMVAYLYFHSGWFTNQIIGMWNKFKKRDLNPHGKRKTD